MKSRRNLTYNLELLQSGCPIVDCRDNACAESLLSTLKMYEIFYKAYGTRQEARSKIMERSHSISNHRCHKIREISSGAETFGIPGIILAV